jgi:PAS domain S-box-containing protein
MINGKKGKYLVLLIIFSAGVFLSASAFYFIYKVEKQNIKGIFDDAAEYHFKYIEDAVQYNMAALYSFGDFYAASQKIDRDEFETFARGIFQRQPYIYEFRWLPRVLRQERQAFESSVRQEGLVDFKIKEIDKKEEGFVTAQERQEYFPVDYLSHSFGVKYAVAKILGLDAASIPERWQAMQRARDTGRTSVVIESKHYAETEINAASRIFLPIYRNKLPHNTLEERRDNLAGFVVLLYRTDDLVKAALEDVPAVGIDISIYAESPEEKRFIYFHPARMRGAPKNINIQVCLEEAKNPYGFSWNRSLQVADQQWLVSCTPCPQFLAAHRIILPWLALFVGIAMTLLLIFYLKNILTRERTIALLVEERSEKLRLAEEKYRMLYESSSDAIMTIAPPEWNFTAANPATLRLFGAKDEQEFITKSPWELSPVRQPDGESSSVKARRMIDVAMERGSYFFDWQHKKISGEEFAATVLLSKVESRGRSFLQATVRDITERKQIEDELRRTLEMKTNFTSTVSHELRTPLAAVKEGIGIVLDGTSGAINKEQKEFLEIAKKNVDRLGRLINDILDFHKLESGKMVFNLRPNDINGVAKEVRELMLSVAEQKNLDFLLELDQGLPQVKFDRDKITQVLTNLVNNAIKFTEKGSIRIQTARKNDAIVVSVQDTGIGIKEEDMPRVFIRFEQLDTGMTRKTGGAGLGLSICKEIIERHNGKIWVDTKFGGGSTFNFTLPVT